MEKGWSVREDFELTSSQVLQRHGLFGSGEIDLPHGRFATLERKGHPLRLTVVLCPAGQDS